MRSHLLLLLPWLAAALPAGAAPLKPVPPDESRDWIRHLLPLPKQVQIADRATVPVSLLRIELPAGAREAVGSLQVPVYALQC